MGPSFDIPMPQFPLLFDMPMLPWYFFFIKGSSVSLYLCHKNLALFAYGDLSFFIRGGECLDGIK